MHPRVRRCRRVQVSESWQCMPSVHVDPCGLFGTSEERALCGHGQLIASLRIRAETSATRAERVWRFARGGRRVGGRDCRMRARAETRDERRGRSVRCSDPSRFGARRVTGGSGATRHSRTGLADAGSRPRRGLILLLGMCVRLLRFERKFC